MGNITSVILLVNSLQHAVNYGNFFLPAPQTVQITCNISSVQTSVSTDLILDTSVLKLLWTPAHSRQRNIPFTMQANLGSVNETCQKLTPEPFSDWHPSSANRASYKRCVRNVSKINIGQTQGVRFSSLDTSFKQYVNQTVHHSLRVS